MKILRRRLAGAAVATFARSCITWAQTHLTRHVRLIVPVAACLIFVTVGIVGAFAAFPVVPSVGSIAKFT